MPCTNSHTTHALLIAKSLLHDKEIQEVRLKVNVPKIHSRAQNHFYEKYVLYIDNLTYGAWLQ